MKRDRFLFFFLLLHMKMEHHFENSKRLCLHLFQVLLITIIFFLKKILSLFRRQIIMDGMHGNYFNNKNKCKKVVSVDTYTLRRRVMCLKSAQGSATRTCEI